MLQYWQHVAPKIGLPLATEPGGRNIFNPIWRRLMAHWGKKEVTFGEMNQLLEQTPGQTASELARSLGVPCSTVTRRLPSMGEAGYKLYEDDKGGLYPFDPQKL